MKKLLAVTGCPTGIAHTFMAAEALQQAAAELGVQIKVETNGAIGVEDELTTAEIQSADCIIIACDKKVDMDRFNGKPVIEVSVGEGIHKAQELIERALSGNVPVRGGSVRQDVPAAKESASLGHELYKHLMNGVSHMLPFVVAGGVLIAISFLWGIFSFDPNSDQYNPFAALLKQIGGYSMGLMVPVLAAYIAQSVANRPGLIAGFVAGVIASDTDSGFIGGIIGGFWRVTSRIFWSRTCPGFPNSMKDLSQYFSCRSSASLSLV